MTGANERPTANASTASGTAVYVLTGRQLTYTISVNGLSAAASGAHIHVGGSTIAGPVVVPFTVSATQSGVVSSGTIDLTYPVVSGSSSISGDSLKVLLENGNAYTNVHNSSSRAASSAGRSRGNSGRHRGRATTRAPRTPALRRALKTGRRTLAGPVVCERVRRVARESTAIARPRVAPDVPIRPRPTYRAPSDRWTGRHVVRQRWRDVTPVAVRPEVDERWPRRLEDHGLV